MNEAYMIVVATPWVVAILGITLVVCYYMGQWYQKMKWNQILQEEDEETYKQDIAVMSQEEEDQEEFKKDIAMMSKEEYENWIKAIEADRSIGN